MSALVISQERNSINATVQLSATLLERAIQATRQTDPSQVEEFINTLVEEALKGTIRWDKNLIHTLNTAIKSLDKILSKQLAIVMHQAKFKKLEGAWRGVHYLVMNTETSRSLKVKILNISKQVLAKDLSKAAEFDQSQLFKKLYENEFGTPGGEPYSALIGDYEFSHQPEDVDTLNKLANVAAAAFCPFISAVDPELFGFNDWNMLAKPRDLEKIFDSMDYLKWRSLRESEDARFITLVMPRVLARLPYGEATKPIEAFHYEEAHYNEAGQPLPLTHADYCWMNAAYVMGTCLTHAFAKYNWCTTIRGAEGGGRISDLPLYRFVSTNGDIDVACPTETGITDRREAELSRLGFLPICHYKNTDYAVFFGAQTLQKPQKYDKPEATANAVISSRLPYIMATSRFAHYLKVMARDKMGSFMEAHDVEIWLNRWIQNYVNGNPDAGQEMKAKYPLAAAKIQVQAVPGKPGAYQAVAWLRPWLQLEELTASLRLVANIPQLN